MVKNKVQKESVSVEFEDEVADEIRMPREAETRGAEMRTQVWQAPSHLPEPTPVPGIRFRWIRVSMLGESDNRNLSKRFREGWEPVRIVDDPKLAQEVSDEGSNFGERGALEIGGLLLCRIEEGLMQQRQRHFEQMSQAQMAAVDAALMRNSDARMPIIAPHRQTREATFGGDG